MKTKTEPKTHSVRLDGFTAFTTSVRDGGQNISVCLFRFGLGMEKGDYVVFTRKTGETTRYRITEARTMRDPKDQHFLDCEFAPRQGPVVEEAQP